MKQGNKKAFTFIEILIVTVLLAIISLTLYATFSNGIKVWQRVTAIAPEEDLAIFFEKFTLDLRNCINSKEIIFLGRKDGFEFAGLVKSQELENTTIGKLIYEYREKQGVLKRQQLDYSRLYLQESGVSNQVLSGIKEFNLAYYFYDEKKKEYLWAEEYMEDSLPIAVRMELELNYGNESNRFIKTVSIPVSS